MPLQHQKRSTEDPAPSPTSEVNPEELGSYKDKLRGMDYDEQQEVLSPLGKVGQMLRHPKQAIYNARLGMKGRKEQVMGDTQDISNQDIILEQLAHRGAYNSIDAKTLEAWGYRTEGAVEDPESGFRAVLFMPTAEALAGETPQAKIIQAVHGGTPPPVLAFRGTDPEKGKRGISDDVNQSGVGTYQMASNHAAVAGMLAAAGGKVIVSGHSLGGALAQLAAARFPGSVLRIVTFQAPAINAKDAAKLKAHNDDAKPEDKISSTHYRAEGDLVHSAGDKLTDGDVFEFQSVGVGYALDHTEYPLARLAAARGMALPGVEGKDGEKSDRLTRVKKSSSDKVKGDWKNRFAEWGRKNVLTGLLDRDMGPYVKLWDDIQALCEGRELDKSERSYIQQLIKNTKELTEVQKVKMRDNFVATYGE
ncbi:MAG: hypothetical protein H6744_13180 [Deltaproteobacteria bacterium]|nr:hypothetical protein [Deltaproteobacteria bacterium]